MIQQNYMKKTVLLKDLNFSCLKFSFRYK